MVEKVLELETGEFEDFIKDGLVLIDFFADWCMPCVMMSPIFDEVSEKFQGKVKFGKLNVGDNQEIASKFNVSSIPNMILFENGKPKANFIGAHSEEDLIKKINEQL